jgi:hypothetical protein
MAMPVILTTDEERRLDARAMTSAVGRCAQDRDARGRQRGSRGSMIADIPA